MVSLSNARQVRASRQILPERSHCGQSAIASLPASRLGIRPFCLMNRVGQRCVRASAPFARTGEKESERAKRQGAQRSRLLALALQSTKLSQRHRQRREFVPQNQCPVFREWVTAGRNFARILRRCVVVLLLRVSYYIHASTLTLFIFLYSSSQRALSNGGRETARTRHARNARYNGAHTHNHAPTQEWRKKWSSRNAPTHTHTHSLKHAPSRKRVLFRIQRQSKNASFARQNKASTHHHPVDFYGFKLDLLFVWRARIIVRRIMGHYIRYDAMVFPTKSMRR